MANFITDSRTHDMVCKVECLFRITAVHVTKSALLPLSSETDFEFSTRMDPLLRDVNPILQSLVQDVIQPPDHEQDVGVTGRSAS